MTCIVIKLILEIIDSIKTSEVLKDEVLRNNILGFINYVNTLPKDLIVRVKYSAFVGWKIKIHEKGYDVPFINVHNKDVEKAFEKAYELLKDINFKDKENEDEKF